MFKKIAHNSTIPALGQNQDLKPLQNLITAEKAVLLSLQKLSVDYSKASEALRTWSLSEGNDLEGILGASTTILNHFSSALSQYATHGHIMREHLKAIRTKEESLDDLQRRRRNVLRKAEDAEKKSSKMGPDNKHFSMQTDILNRFREDIRAMDSDIMLEEAALGDFKRSATKVWMGLKFGGLFECCEKGMIVGEFGRLAIAEISEEMTQPGLPRSFNYPQTKIENFVAEAYRGVNMVTLSTFPSASPDAPAFCILPRTHRETSRNPRLSSEPQSPPTFNNGSSMLSSELQPSPTSAFHNDNANYQPTRTFDGANGYPPEHFGVNDGAMGTFGVNIRSPSPQRHQQFSQGSIDSSYSQTLPRGNEGAMDDFGVNARSVDPPYQPKTSATPSFSQISSSSQQSGVNEAVVENFGGSVSPAPHHQQQYFEGYANPSFSHTTLPPQPVAVNEGAVNNVGANVHSTGSPYQQQFSPGAVNSSFPQPLFPSAHPRVNESAVNPNVRSTVPPYQTVNPSFSQTLPLSQQRRVDQDTLDDFGVNLRSSPPHQQRLPLGSVSSPLSSLPNQRLNGGAMDDYVPNGRPADSSNTTGDQSARFPVQTRPSGATGGYSLQDPGSGSHDWSFSASVADALHEKFDGQNPEIKLSPQADNRFNVSQPSTNSEGAAKDSSNQLTNPWGSHSDGDPGPLMSPLMSNADSVPVGTNKYLSDQPEFANPQNPPPEGSSKPSSPRSPMSSQSSEHHDALPTRMSEGSGGRETPTQTAIPFSVPPATTTKIAAVSSPHTKEDSRHVRFGSVEDVDQQFEQRVSLDKQPATPTRLIGPRGSPRTGKTNSTVNDPPQQNISTAADVNNHGPSDPIKSGTRRVPPPNLDLWEEEALNAAAARELSLEREALKNNNQNQLQSQIDQKSQPPPTPDVDGGRTMRPQPHPYAELNPPGTYAHYSTSQSYGQAPYQTSPTSPGQSFQQQQKPQAPEMRNPPPRFQAYNNNVPMESQVPPRFQTSSSPIINSLPPRFQTNYTPQVSTPGGLSS